MHTFTLTKLTFPSFLHSGHDDSQGLSCAWASSLPDADKTKLSAMLKKRHNVAAEIAKTETTYVTLLNCLVQRFVCEFRQTSRGLSADDVYHMFSNIEVIRDCHERLLASLKQRVDAWDPNAAIGDIFLKAAWIKLYRYYVNNYDNAVSTVKQCKEKHPAFRQYMDDIEYSGTLFGLGLEGLLITPVQRIPRYVLLLTDMVKTTPSCHPDYQNLNDALAVIRELASYVNQRKMDSENASQLNAIQSQLSGFSGTLVTSAGRQFIKHGPFTINKKKEHLWLFSDIIIRTKPEQKQKYKYRQTISLKTCSLQAHADGFTLFCPEGNFVCHLPATHDAAPSPAFPASSTTPQPTGTPMAAAPAAAPTPLAADEWIKVINLNIQSARNDLIASAFVDKAMVSTSEGSRHFDELLASEHGRKRQSVVQRILESERAYVRLVVHLRDAYIIPMVEDHPDLVPHVKQMAELHARFLADIEIRASQWDDSKCLSDIFANVDFHSVYVVFVTLYAEYMRSVEANPKSVALVTEVEARDHSQPTFRCCMERPLKRVSEYYLLLQEFSLYNTSKKHDVSHEALLRELVRLRETTDDLLAKGSAAATAT
eukprot:TRINITY_DN416_c0_g1_i3.p1 TRINITY_DN416_c0_g1~~TRINITY_DN416_c0_g1_i3.p1  ORF type:complete len:597 (-),score=147.43 TRINITY_DN416_c0_g1_i3:56-1846(-)